MSNLVKIRDQILESLQTQFAAKVRAIELQWDGAYDVADPEVGRFLRDLASNITQGFADDDECSLCGGPSNREDRCPTCSGKIDEGDTNATLGLSQGVQKP